MGQAKQRGDLEFRKSEAITRNLELQNKKKLDEQMRLESLTPEQRQYEADIRHKFNAYIAFAIGSSIRSSLENKS